MFIATIPSFEEQEEIPSEEGEEDVIVINRLAELAPFLNMGK